MALATRCPACHTTFRVVADQLKLRQGLVRCGQCRHVFNGIEQMKYLANATSTSAASVQASSAATARVSASNAGAFNAALDTVPASVTPTASELGKLETLTVDSITQNLPIPEMESLSTFAKNSAPPAIPPLTSPSPVSSPLANQADPAPNDQIAHQAVAPAEPAPQPSSEVEAPLTLTHLETTPASAPADLPSFLHHAPRAWWLSATLALAIVTSALALAAQLTYFYRSEIAATFPASRAWLQSACAHLPAAWRCQVNPPRRLAHLKIADAEVIEDALPNQYVLRATLKNESEQVRAFPALEVTLSNALNTVLTRRVLSPEVYLSGNANAARLLEQGLPANKEWPVNLTFMLADPASQPNAAKSTGDKIAGYVVDIFYP